MLGVRATVIPVVVLILIGFTGISSASTGKPWWHLTLDSRPSSIAPSAGRDEVQEIIVTPNTAFTLKGFLKSRFDRSASKAYRFAVLILVLSAGLLLTFVQAAAAQSTSKCEQHAEALLSQMSLDEKIGQMTQVDMIARQEQGNL